MTRQTTKEQVAFLVGAALLLWALVKLGLFITHQSRPLGTPMATAAPPQGGDSEIAAFLAAHGLDGYLDRGSRDPFFPDKSEATQVYARAAIAHSFLRSTSTTGYGVISSYTFDFRMCPNPARELRLHVPAGLNIVGVFSKEMDDARKWGVDGRTLVVPVNPVLVRRCFYRCQITVKAQGPITLPAGWTAPIVACTDATPNVLCDVGHITIATPGESVEVTPRESAQSTLGRIALELVPKELAALSNKFAYFYRQPNYTLTLDVKSTAISHKIDTSKRVTTKDHPAPVVGGKKPGTGTVVVKEEPKKLDIPRAGDADTLPFKLVAIVRIHEPEPRRQAVLRDKDTDEYLRKFEGDIVRDDLRIQTITDDAVVVVDSKGKTYKFAGRFDDQYNTALNQEGPGTKKGPTPPKGGPPRPKPRGG